MESHHPIMRKLRDLGGQTYRYTNRQGAVIPVMNWLLPEGGTIVSEHEFIKLLGMWFVMGYYKVNWVWQDWWSKEDIRIGIGYLFHFN